MVATSMGKRVAPNGSNGDGGAAGGGQNGAGHIQHEFHSPDIDVPADVVQYTQDKLNARLAKYGRRVMGVLVHIRDVNGPKGGVGVVCHMEARLSGMEPVNVEEPEPDLRAAIDLAIGRLEEVVGRQVDRARSLPRHRGRKQVRSQKLGV